MNVESMKKLLAERGFIVAQRDHDVIPEEAGDGVWMVLNKDVDDYYACVGDCLETLLERAIKENADKFPGLRDPGTIPSSARFFTERLAHILEAQGWSTAELATACEIPLSTMARYCDGSIVPPMEKVEGIADVLLISPAWLGFGLGPIHLEPEP